MARQLRVLALALSSWQPNFVDADVQFFPAPPIAADPNVTLEHLVLSTKRQTHIKAFLATVASPVGFLHTLPPTSSGCTEMVKV